LGSDLFTEKEKQSDIADVVRLLKRLSPVQVDVIRAIIHRFADEQESQILRDDFLTKPVFEFFSMRLAAHHAYSSSVLKKENFEHILEQAFKRCGIPAARANSMTVRGADLKVDNVTLSLKTEAAQGIRQDAITISKLMEAAWIKQITSTNDIPGYIKSMVMPHFNNYDRIFILRSYVSPKRHGHIRYDLREIPKSLLALVGTLKPTDFSTLTRTRTTSAPVIVKGRQAFKFRLDGSDDKLTINALDVDLCPLHAWWSLAKPD
jgi:type II restriction enzyme